MCGICGEIDFRHQSINAGVTKRMCDVLAHRGPDDEGMVFIKGDQYIEVNKSSALVKKENSFEVSLGHRRLSIIDLSEGGHKPMCNENGTIWIVFNGEIYNFQEIKKGLEGKGHLFKSKSDTEVVLHAYEEWDVECLKYHGREAVADNASAYIQARQRLPQECLERVLAATAQAAERRAAPSWQLQGRPVKVVDGSSVQLPDTAANQQDYPQPSGQQPGCGLPVLKLVVSFSLASGALLDVVIGNLHSQDLRLFHRLWECLQAGDILLGDRAYGEYATLAGLPRQGVDVVARLHSRRKVDFRKARQRLGFLIPERKG